MPAPISVLVVEDDPQVARAFTRQLLALGLSHRLAGSSQAVLGDDTNYLVAIVDIHLPDGNGIELLEVLKERGRVVDGFFFSATNDSKEHSRARNVARFIHKSAGVQAAIRAAMEKLDPQQAPHSETRSSSSKIPCSTTSDHEPLKKSTSHS